MFWYKGNLLKSCTVELAIDDPGLLYGATVFTTLRVYRASLDSPLTNWTGHCDRLQTSLKTFNWQQPNWHRLRQGAEIMMNHWPVLRIALFPDGRELITGRFLPEDLTKRQQNGIIAKLADYAQFQRSLPTHKTGNYLSAWLALQTAKQCDAQEAILVDAAGNWLETSTGNLWGWRDGCWWTPPVEAGILPGLMRDLLVRRLAIQRQPVLEEPWTAEVVEGFEAIAYTNSVVEIVPIHTVITRSTQLTYNPNHPAFQQFGNW